MRLLPIAMFLLPAGLAVMLTGAAAAEAAAQTSPTPAKHVAPSFDCSKAEGSAQKLVCADARLAILDNELSRLYALAARGKWMDDARRKELKATQRGWIEGRDDCWKATDLRECVLAEYVSRIHGLREGYAGSRSNDAAGISDGPLALECRGLDALISVTRVKGKPEALYFAWRDKSLVMERKDDPAGILFMGHSYDGRYTFWEVGGRLSFEQPDKEVVQCEYVPMG